MLGEHPPSQLGHIYRNWAIDFFRQSVVKKISLKGLERVISFAAEGDKIYMRNYRSVISVNKLSGYTTLLSMPRFFFGAQNGFEEIRNAYPKS